ncbi:MAG: gamma-glutamyltransferase, partial [Planctomycetota bacterium JB042]
MSPSALVLVPVLAIVSSDGATDVPLLSPAGWSAAEREGVLSLAPRPRRAWPDDAVDGGLIVGSSMPFAVTAGRKALEAGGSAVDAAIVTAFAQIVQTGGSWNSFAGIFELLHFDAATGAVEVVNGGFVVPAGETDGATIPRSGPTGRSALVPGFFPAVAEAHRRFGRIPWASLFEPAIWLAEHGFRVDAGLAGTLAWRRPSLSRLAATRAIFTTDDGSWLEEGDLFRQPALAATLRAIQRDGVRHVTTGPWAERFVAAVRAEGGTLSLDDLARYRPQTGAPLAVDYHGHRVHTLPPPEFGAVQLAEALAVLEVADLPRDRHSTASADVLFPLMQICRYGHVVSYTPDAYHPTERPRIFGQMTPSERLAPAAARATWERIRRGDWEDALWHELRARLVHSDTNVVVDVEGNVAVTLHSINSLMWGETGLFVDGISIPDSGAVQPHVVARVGPGARLPNLTNPCLVTKDGRAVLGAACIGSSLHENMVQALVDVLDHGMTPAESASSQSPR